MQVFKDTLGYFLVLSFSITTGYPMFPIKGGGGREEFKGGIDGREVEEDDAFKFIGGGGGRDGFREVLESDGGGGKLGNILLPNEEGGGGGGGKIHELCYVLGLELFYSCILIFDREGGGGNKEFILGLLSFFFKSYFIFSIYDFKWDIYFMSFLTY